MPDDEARTQAKDAGRQAFREGLPCVSPPMEYGSLEASWRLGWKIEAAKVGLFIPKEH